MKKLFGLLAVVLALFGALGQPAFAGPLSYYNSPLDSPNSAANAVVAAYNNASPAAAYLSSCTGTTTATCTGLRFTVSVTGLTTTAGVTSASMTVTNTSIALASQVFCQANGYGGTGNAQPVNLVQTASTLVFQVQNTHASAALNATVPISCIVFN